jgi:hypothetical protein
MDAILGCITQPAHAALAGRLAATLNGQLLDEVPEGIIETIAGHDAGWSEIDLSALKDAEHILMDRLQDGTSLELQEFVDCALAILKDSPQLVPPSVTGTNDVAERHGSHST